MAFREEHILSISSSLSNRLSDAKGFPFSAGGSGWFPALTATISGTEGQKDNSFRLFYFVVLLKFV